MYGGSGSARIQVCAAVGKAHGRSASVRGGAACEAEHSAERVHCVDINIVVRGVTDHCVCAGRLHANVSKSCVRKRKGLHNGERISVHRQYIDYIRASRGSKAVEYGEGGVTRQHFGTIDAANGTCFCNSARLLAVKVCGCAGCAPCVRILQERQAEQCQLRHGIRC